MTLEIVQQDHYLNPYEGALHWRIERFNRKLADLTNGNKDLGQFALGHLYYGVQKADEEWVLREWAPGALKIYLYGDFCNWQLRDEFAFKRINSQGDFELRLPLAQLQHKTQFKLKVEWHGGSGDRLPAYVRRVVQDDETKVFSAQIWDPPAPERYRWKHDQFRRKDESPLIYEAHVGMAQEEERVGSYLEFKEKVLPRIVRAGYNTVQFMAVMEHPYYGSFGYQVSNFFAVSSRSGTPEEFKELVDACHAEGLTVIMDIVHSHAVRNEVEGISCQDGTLYQYFHGGQHGFHPAWDSRCFDYGKNEVIHFLLSNCRFWLDEYKIDGFRFDGVTSMLYFDRGHKAFDHYDHYFNDGVDLDAFIYLALANHLIHQLRPDAITIAEDMSGMPGSCTLPEKGGLGFDYRLAMGMPDLWIRIIKHVADEHWNVNEIWNELSNRRADAKTIAYCESHDQALVGDKTIIFRLIDKEMYWHMNKGSSSLEVERGVALHKMIRLVTCSAGGDGYLNFIGNEFGHPQWIDFPREGNDWSYHYARRQWNLIDNPGLRYQALAEFDRDMINICKESLQSRYANFIVANQSDQVLAYSRGDFIYVFNFSPCTSYTDYGIQLPPGEYHLTISSDEVKYDGLGRVSLPQKYHWHANGGQNGWVDLYLPTRTVLVLKRINS